MNYFRSSVFVMPQIDGNAHMAFLDIPTSEQEYDIHWLFLDILQVKSVLLTLPRTFQIESNIYMVYNMGSETLSISDLGERVDDGQYHVVRATRNGPNSTLQLDSRPVETKFPRGQSTLRRTYRLIFINLVCSLASAR